MDKDLISQVAAEMGRRGGRSRARALSPKRRSEIARLGGLARWPKRSKKG